MNHFNIAIDGPAGAGKSTIAREAARRMGLVYVDTGAMYRAIALYIMEQGIDPADEAAVVQACGQIQIDLNYEQGVQKMILNGQDVSDKIRTEEVGNMTSAVSTYPAVREKLTHLQKKLAQEQSVIMDGRDIGTCVLPDAPVKIYLTASPHVRALRRYHELQAKNTPCELENIEKIIIDRDYRDMHRANAPLKQAEDAVLIDSSQMTLEEVINRVMEIAAEKGFQVKS